MQCFHPRDVKVQQKVSWNHYVDRYIRVPCGKCFACRRKRQQDWSFRIQEEARSCVQKGGSVYFVTLTYDDDHLPHMIDKDTGEMFGVPSLNTLEIGKFVRKLRKRFGSESLRYFGCGEYGDHKTDNLRPHYHVVLFLKENMRAEQLRPFIIDSWGKGLVLGIYPISSKLAEYVAKYSLKRVGQDYSDRVPPFARMSLKPAIGSVFLGSSECRSYVKNQSFVVYDFSGNSFGLPRYFRDRMYSKEFLDARRVSLERQNLSLQEVNLRRDPLCLFKRYQANVRFEENLIKSINLALQC